MNNFKPVLLALVWLAIAAGALSAQGDITGVWEVTVETPQGAASIDATFKQAGETITGEVVSPMGAAEFQGTLVKDALTITYAVPVQGNTLDIVMAGKITGDTMAGTISLGGAGEATWSAKRKPAGAAADAAPSASVPAAPDAAAPHAVAAAPGTGVGGTWNVALHTPQGEMSLSAALVQEGDRVRGTLSSPIGEVPISGTFKDSVLHMEFVTPTQNGDVKITMSGNLVAAGLTGKADFGGLGEADWTATRVE